MGKSAAPVGTLGTFALIMIAIVSVDSLRNLPIAAQYGFSLITFYLLGGLFFFIPLAFVASKLAVRYPRTGGSYIWISEAFGTRYGNLAIWLQWIYNIIWCPTIFVFISVTIASMISPNLESHRGFIMAVSLAGFWGLSLLLCRGIHVTGVIGIISAIFGTIIPMALIILLGAFWLLSGKPPASPMTGHDLIPKAHDLANIAFFSNILFSLLGQEVIAMHAGNVRNPGRAYPRAFYISAIIILFTMIASSLALCVIMPSEKIALASGLIDVLEEFFQHYHMHNMSLLIGLFIVIGGFGIASSWIIGLARGLQVSFTKMEVPAWLSRLNDNHMPSGVLIFQGITFTALLSCFIFSDNINDSYWILSVITAQFALLYYILLFSAAIKLLAGNILLPCFGILTCIVGIVTGFVPPDVVTGHARTLYVILMPAIFLLIMFGLVYKFILRAKDKQ